MPNGDAPGRAAQGNSGYTYERYMIVSIKACSIYMPCHLIEGASTIVITFMSVRVFVTPSPKEYFENVDFTNSAP